MYVMVCALMLHGVTGHHPGSDDSTCIRHIFSWWQNIWSPKIHVYIVLFKSAYHWCISWVQSAPCLLLGGLQAVPCSAWCACVFTLSMNLLFGCWRCFQWTGYLAYSVWVSTCRFGITKDNPYRLVLDNLHVGLVGEAFSQSDHFSSITEVQIKYRNRNIIFLKQRTFCKM